MARTRKPKIDRTALICAVDLLARQDQSENRLRQKLIDRKYSEDEINDAIEKLKKYNYLNDERACSNQFEIMYQSNRYSVRQISNKLFQMGFSKELIASFTPENYDEHDELTAIRFLKSKFKTLPENKKMWQFLSTKGFAYSVVSNAIEKFKIDMEDTD